MNFNRRYIMKVTYQFVITAVLLTAITQTEEIKQCSGKALFSSMSKVEQFFRDNSGENSVNACIRGEKKKLYEIGIWM